MFFAVFFSCSKKNIDNVKFNFFDFSEMKNKAIKFKAIKGYKLTEIDGGGEWKEIRLDYLDGSVLYVNNKDGIPLLNSENIRKHDSMPFFFNDKNQDFIISGIEDNKHWRNKKTKLLNIGYLNVSTTNKKQYDSIISVIEKSNKSLHGNVKN